MSNNEPPSGREAHEKELSFTACVAKLREHYTEFLHLDDVEFLIKVETKLHELKQCDDLTEREQALVKELPNITQYLW